MSLQPNWQDRDPAEAPVKKSSDGLVCAEQ